MPPVSQIGEYLRQLVQHHVVGAGGGGPAVGLGHVGLGARQRGRDVAVDGALLVQLHHVGHAAGPEHLVTRHLFCPAV